MLKDRPAPVKWKTAPDLGPVTASAEHLLVFEMLRRSGLFADLPGSNDRLQGWTDAQMLTALALTVSWMSPALKRTRVCGWSRRLPVCRGGVSPSVFDGVAPAFSR